MKGLLRALLMLGCIAYLATARGEQDYLLLDDFFAQYPQQRQLTEALRAQVKQAPVPLAPAHRQPVRVAVVYPAHQRSDYWRRSLEVFTRRLDQLAVNYQLHSYFGRPSLDGDQQQLREALQHDPDYLVFTLDSEAHKRVIERILARGRPKLILQNITTPLRDWQGSQPLLYSGFDHQQGTRILADTLFGRLQPAPRKVSVIFRDKGYVSAMRGQTFIDLLGKHGAELVSSYYTDSDRDSAYRAALNALDQDPDLDLIYACSTDVALGVVDALKERGLQGRVRVNGWGGGREELAAIAANDLDLTVVRLNEESSIAMAEAIKNDLADRPVPQVYNGRMEALTRFDSAAAQRELAQRAFPVSRPQ